MTIVLRYTLLFLFACTPFALRAADLTKADQLYAQRTETTGAAEALALYEQAAAANPSEVAPLWKAARATYWLADHAKAKKEKIALFEKGIAIAKKAVELDPKSIEAHFWLGGLYGSYGEVKGVMKSLALVKPIRQEMNAINQLDEKFQGGAGYRVLGIVDYKVPGIAGGSKKRAREQLEKAVAMDPSNAFNQYYMAEFLGTAGGDKKKALEHLDILKGLTPTADVDAADLKMMKERGERLRGQIGT